jgi:predicted enzyme related to lactoylglutathione lyase
VAQPVVHLEIIGTDPGRLRTFYSALFGWEFDTSAPISAAVSEAGNYGFTEGPQGGPVPGGVGGGPGYEPHVMFYVGVEDIEATLAKAESLGGTRRLGPERVEGRDLVIGHFTDPAGNLIGLAGPA